MPVLSKKKCLLLEHHYDSELNKYFFNCSKEEFQNAINNQVPLVYPYDGSGSQDAGTIIYVHLTAIVARPRDPETNKLKPDEFYSDTSVHLTGMNIDYTITTTASLRLLYIDVNMNDMSFDITNKYSSISYSQ